MAKVVNLEIDQGTTFSTTVTLKDTNGDLIDLSGHIGAGSIKKHPGSAVVYDMNITLGGNTGQVTISLSPTISDDIPHGRYIYDVSLLSDTGTYSRVIEGTAFINPQVTRWPQP